MKMRDMRKVMFVAICLLAGVTNAATGKSAAFPLDLREGDRVSAGTEELTYSNLWDGDAEATVTIAQDGVSIEYGLTGEGVKPWTVDRNGRYELTHTVYTNGVKGKVETAVFVVEGKEVPVSELTLEWETGSYKYDSNGKTPGVTAKDGDTLLVKGVDYTVRYEGNTNAGTAKAILTGLPPYVGSVTNEFVIAKRLVELTSGTDSKAYDGTPLVCHSVTTNSDGFVVGEGVDFTFTGSQTVAGSSKNTFDYTFKTGTSAWNYTITKTEGDLEVTKGTLPPDVKPDPVEPDSSDLLKPYSGFDYVGVYDGAAHTIKTNELVAAYAAAVGEGMSVSYAAGEVDAQPTVGWSAVAPKYTEVGTNVVWYKVSSANYADIVHVAKVAIREQPRVTGVTARQRYPWNGLVDITVTIQGAAEDVAEADCVVVAVDNANQSEILIKHISRVGTDLGEGYVWTRKFIWDAGADLPDGFIGERISVEANMKWPQNPLVENLYMVIDLNEGKNAKTYPVTYLKDVPAGGWTDEYKTTIAPAMNYIDSAA